LLIIIHPYAPCAFFLPTVHNGQVEGGILHAPFGVLY